MVNKRPTLPPELLKYAQSLYPDLGLQDESEQLPDIEEGIAQVEKDYAQKQQEDEAAMMQDQLEPLDVNEEADQEELGQQQMQSIDDLIASQQAEAKKQQSQIQEDELDSTMESKMQEDAVKAAPKQEEDIQQKSLQVSRAPSYEEQVMQLTKEKQKQEDMYDTWESISNIGSAFSGAPTNTAAYEKMRKRAGRPLENLMLEKKLKDDKIKKDIENVTLAQELQDKKAKSDPNSGISRMAKAALIQAGMKSLEEYPDVSYSQLEKMLPNLMQSLYTQFAARAKVSAQALASEVQRQKITQSAQQFSINQEFKNRQLEQEREIKETEANLKRQGIEVNRDLKKEAAETNKLNTKFNQDVKLTTLATNRVTAMQKDKNYDAFYNADEAIDSLTALIEAKKLGKPVKIEEGANFFKYAKLAQGDSSVVRESDIKNLAGGTDFTKFQQLVQKLEARLKGEQFTLRDLEAMQAVVRGVKKAKQRRVYNDFVKPLRKWAEDEKYDLDRNISTEALDEVAADFIEEEQAAEDEKRIKELNKKMGIEG